MNPKPIVSKSNPQIKHDGKLTIAVGSSRHEKTWKHRTLLWSQLVGKLATTSVSHETMAEYLALPKIRQDELKDVGAFVGGSLKGGRRSAQTVVWRQLLTLDADNAGQGFWQLFQINYECAACIYSTRKHTEVKPRLRLVMPLSRPVTPDEYQAISRQVAGTLGSDLFDDTTHEPERLMYWPSTCAGSPFVFEAQDGYWLDVDAELAKYGPDDAWKNPSLWPMPAGAVKKRQAEMQKQGDPLTKKGLVGAYCRTYTIRQAIEKFLPDVYIEAGPGRWTYTKGSTSAGAVEYDEKFLYSHHGTDPISMQTVNAWDMVRIHKFAELDETMKEGTPVVQRPSTKEMNALALADEDVLRTLDREKIESAQEDFTREEGADDLAFMGKLDRTKDGGFRVNAKNCILILKHDPNLKDLIAFDSFNRRRVVRGDLPWRKLEATGPNWTDDDDAGLRNYFDRIYDIAGRNVIFDALCQVTSENTFHPVRDYLNAQEWDGNERVDSLLIDYFGAADTPYVRAVSRMTLVAAVARVMKPGVKYDNMLVLIGPQGIGKSYFLFRLAKRWFTDSLTCMAGAKDAYEQLLGKWIVEVSEMSAAGRSAVEQVKLFLSKQVDSFRPAYGRNLIDFPRQCVFIGTTNRTDFLQDATGNRRFLPIKAGVTQPARSVFNDLIDTEIDHIWAEAVKLYQEGTPLFLSGSLAATAAEAQSDHLEESEKFGQVQDFLRAPLPAGWGELSLYERRNHIHGRQKVEGETVERTRVCVSEIWAELFEGDSKTLDRLRSREIRDIMLRMPGWQMHTRKMKFRHYGTQRGYIRIDQSTATVED